MINVTWSQLKQILSSSGGTVQWFSDDNSYSIFDSSFTFQTTIAFSMPPSSDQTDFETNYKNTGVSFPHTYSCSGVVISGASTDIAVLTGSATKVVRLSKITISGRNSLPTTASVSLVSRSSADSGGTSSTPNIVAHDSNASAATASVNLYTVNPTPGQSVGVLRIASQEFPNTGGNAVPILVWDFSGDPKHRPTLRSNSQQLCVNMNGTQVSAVHVSIEWSEE